MYHHEHETGCESPTAVHGLFMAEEAEDFFVDVGAPWKGGNEESSKKKRGRDTDEGALMMLDFATAGGDEFDPNPHPKSPKRVPKSSPNKPVPSPMSPMSALSSMSICDDISDTSFTARCARLDSGCLPPTVARAVVGVGVGVSVGRGPAPAVRLMSVETEEVMLPPKEPLSPSSVESAKRRELQDVAARADDGQQSAWVAPNECARAVVDIDATAQRLTLTHFNKSFLRIFCDGSPVDKMNGGALDLSQFFGADTDTNEVLSLRQAMQAGGRHLSMLRLYTLVHRHVRRVHVTLTVFASPEPLPGLARRSVGVLTFRDICTVAHSVRHGFPLIAPRIAPSFKDTLLEKYCNSVGLRRNFKHLEPRAPKAAAAPERPPTPMPAASLMAAGPQLNFASAVPLLVHAQQQQQQQHHHHHHQPPPPLLHVLHMQHMQTDSSYVPVVAEKGHLPLHSHFGTSVHVIDTSCSAASYAMTITDEEIADAVLV